MISRMTGPTVDVQHRFLPYRYADYTAWCRADQVTLDAYLAVTGDLNRTRETYFNQAGMRQNFPEVACARDLIERHRFPRETIFFENYSLDAEGIGKALGGDPQKRVATGAQHVGRVLSAAFLSGFQRFHNNHRTEIHKTLAGTKVDLCAIDFPRRRFALVETKLFRRGGETTDKWSPHQRFTLDASSHLFETLGASAFADGRPFEVTLAFVALHPDDEPAPNASWPPKFELAMDLPR